ncbi:hypothetical protein AYO22_01552 [Fonsecaea multimorphosa]|nr:hypothetical protein AYO22_01552 [Fonsecaea multimorphosa]
MKTLKPATKPSGNAKTTSKPRRRTSRGRTSRALKKAKCDGDQACKLCRATDSECVYSARRREARNYYYQMREVTDLALQKLYWACRRRTGFPGDIPDESNGEVSTIDILKGLGLWRPSLDESNFPGEVEQAAHTFHNKGRGQRRLQAIIARDELEEVEKQSDASTGSSPSSPRTSNAGVAVTRTNTTGNSTNTSLPLELESEVPTLCEDMDMKRQFEIASSLSPAPRSANHSSKRAFSHDEQPFLRETLMEPQLDVDAFVDMSLCTSPVPQSSPPFYGQSMTFSMPALSTLPAMATLPQFPYGQSPHQPSRDALFDSYLSVWPGSTVAAHRAAPTG